MAVTWKRVVTENLTSTAGMSFVIDEDNMASNLNTKVPTQQSVKAYVDAHSGGGFGGLYSNLSIKNNSTNPNYQMDVSVTTVLLEDSSKAILRIDALSETVDITASGANGLDTGSEAGSTWYHIWAIAKADGTKDCLLSTSATAPTFPSGYTYRAYLGAVYNDSGSNFDPIVQVDNTVVSQFVWLVEAGTATSLTSVDASVVVPTTAKFICLDGRANMTSGAGTVALQLACNSAGAGARNCQFYTDGSGYMGGAQPDLPLTTAQTFYYVTNSGNRVYVGVFGWKY